MEKNKIYLDDCVEGMNKILPESVDIVVTSPPYNLDIKYNKYKDNKTNVDYLIWIEQVCNAIHRVMKENGHLFLNVGYSNISPFIAMDVANIFRKKFILQNNITWVKSIAIDNRTRGHFKPINSNRFITPTNESIFHFTKNGNVEINRLAVGVPYEYYESNLRNEKTKNTKPNLRCKGNTWFIPYETINSKDLKGKHPAVFPVKLVEDCISISGINQGVLLDPFMGTGSSAVAAINKGIDWIGFEMDSDYLNFANNRILQKTKSVLF
jgi:site-specific DNA-methyltransferase (adenine-specific)